MHRISMLLVTALAVIFFGFTPLTSAFAADNSITCEPPTKNTDGSALTDLAGFKLYGAVVGAPKTLIATSSVGAGCSFVHKGVAVGTYEYQVTAYTTKDVESDPTNAVTVIDVPPPPADGDGDGVPDTSDQCPTVVGVAPTGCPLKPNPPTNLTVKQLLAYEMRGSTSTNNLRMVSIGVVPEGTSCLQTAVVVGAKTYNQLQKSTVDLYNVPAKLPPIVWGLCG